MKIITHVAIINDGKIYSLPKPNRHHHLIKLIFEENGKGLTRGQIQGFLDSDGNFVDRFEALKIALEAKQVLNEKDIRAERLFSEDLW